MNTTPSDRSWWALTCNKMENNGNIYQLKGNALLLSNSHHSLEAPITVSKNDTNSSFVHHALTLSTERGQKYVGSQWHSWPEELGEPAISWSTNDEELLVPSRPFPHPIALPNLFAQESQNNGGNPCSQVRERREPDSTTPVHLEEPSKNLAKYIVAPYSPTYTGIPSLFSPVHPFSPQCSSPYNNSRFNWQFVSREGWRQRSRS